MCVSNLFFEEISNVLFAYLVSSMSRKQHQRILKIELLTPLKDTGNDHI